MHILMNVLIQFSCTIYKLCINSKALIIPILTVILSTISKQDHAARLGIKLYISIHFGN